MDSIRDFVDRFEDADTKRRLQAEFASVDRRAVGELSDVELAAWQARYPADSPQHRLGEHEWQSRLTAEQTKATRFAALLGLFGVVLGFALGKWA